MCQMDEQERREEAARAGFIKGAQVMREMIVRQMEAEGCYAAFIALRPEFRTCGAAIKACWQHGWGKDPGKLDGNIPEVIWDAIDF